LCLATLMPAAPVDVVNHSHFKFFDKTEFSF
jgi:hypothetical protein